MHGPCFSPALRRECFGSCLQSPGKEVASRLGRDTTRAGEGTRTLDIQLGKRQGPSSKCSRRSTYVEPFRPLYRWLYLRQPWGPRAASLTACRLLDARSRVDGADRGLGLPIPSHPGRHPRHGEGVGGMSLGRTADDADDRIPPLRACGVVSHDRRFSWGG